MFTRAALLALGSIVIGIGSACSHGPTRSSASAAEGPTSDQAEAPATIDPLAGEYPQILWHCNVWEVPAESCFTPEGTLRANCPPKSNGMTIATAEQWRATTESIRSLPGARHLASPAVFTRPGSAGRIPAHHEDKAGASTGERSIAVEGTLGTKSVVATLEVVNHRSGAVGSCRAEALAIPEGGAFYLLCPGPDLSRPWTLVSVHPVVLRSVADYPFQRASALIEEEPAPAK